MIYIIQIPNIQLFKDNFIEWKEVIIGEHTVLHISTTSFLQQCFIDGFNKVKTNSLAQIVNNYTILQIENNE